MALNYTETEVQFMIVEYQNDPSRDTVEKLATELNKSVKSIIGKLSREGVYKKTVYKTKTGETPETKKEIVEEVANWLDIEYQTVAGLEKSPKASLKSLREALREELGLMQ